MEGRWTPASSLIMDNYVTHKTDQVKRWFNRHSRFHVHFTPTSASWLNQIERWFALLTQRQIKRGTHRSTQALEKAIREYLRNYNEIFAGPTDPALSALVNLYDIHYSSHHIMGTSGGGKEDITDEHHGLWCPEAERFLLENGPAI